MNKTAICLLLLLTFLPATPCRAATRHYYIAAEDVMWDYAPSGLDLLHGRPIPEPWANQTRWAKTRFIEYTDSTFSTRKPQPVWLGILGPVIRAEVGDTIVVDFLNRSQLPHNIHPHGLRYDKDNEGGFYVPTGRGSQVPPSSHFTYRWFADKASGPGPGDPSSVVWWYHPHLEESQETNAGLLGAIIVSAKGALKTDGTPNGVDREFVASFMIFDELKGKDAGLFHTINGYIFGNLPGLDMKNGERVRWYLLGMGNERDIHTPHWHGKTVLHGMRHTDVIELLPASMVTVDMIADNPGTWLFHCQVSDHMEAGMMATYTIYRLARQPCPVEFVSGEFWRRNGKFTIDVENRSRKVIRHLVITSGNLLTPQYLRPYVGDWTWNKPILPGQKQTLEMKDYLRDSDDIPAWAFYPTKIVYEDGTEWKPQESGECFHVFWRDKKHPQIDVLPPLQLELDED